MNNPTYLNDRQMNDFREVKAPAEITPIKMFRREPQSPWSIWLCCLLLVSTFCGCAGYHLGNQFLYRSDVRTVHVPMFESNSYRRFLGQRMTEAVVKEIELTTPLTITEPALADSFIRGRIVDDRKLVAGENVNDEPRSLNLAWRVEVSWVDRAGVPLMQRQSIRINRDATFVPEGGQSLSTAQQQIIERVARDIIGQMEVPSL